MELKLPRRIKDVVYVKSVNTTQKKYKVAIYRNSEGKKVVLKAISRFPLISFYRYWIKNEINVLKYLNSLSNSEVFFPKFLFEFKNNNIKSFATEFIEGERIDKLSLEEKVKIYNSVILNLHKINAKNELSRTLRIKKYRYYLCFSLADFLVSFLKGNFLISIKLISNIISLYGQIDKQSKLVLSHCDLFDSNIIKSGKKLFLIDFEKTCLTEKEVDISFLLIRYWKEKKFIFKLLSTQKLNSKKLAFLILYLGLSDLATSSDLDKKSLFEFIEFGFELAKK